MLIARELIVHETTVPGLCCEVVDVVLGLVLVVSTGKVVVERCAVKNRERDRRFCDKVTSEEVTRRDNECEGALTNVPDAVKLGIFTETKVE